MALEQNGAGVCANLKGRKILGGKGKALSLKLVEKKTLNPTPQAISPNTREAPWQKKKKGPKKEGPKG